VHCTRFVTLMHLYYNLVALTLTLTLTFTGTTLFGDRQCPIRPPLSPNPTSP